MNINIKKYQEQFISFIVICYNQEDFVEDALNSVFDQDYSNYEIIISDDASTDKTAAIIQDFIGNHNSKAKEVFFNKNKTNLGIVGNFTKALSMAKGEWIIGMGGDDISYLDRLAYTNQLINQNKGIYAISCAFKVISKTGKYMPSREIYHFKPNQFKLPYYNPPSSAIHRDCFKKFEPVSKKTFSEDIIYSMRAFLLGGICISDRIVTKRRIHDNNTSVALNYSTYESLEKRKMSFYSTFGALQQAKLDTIHVINDIEKQKKIIDLIDKETQRRHEMIKELEAIQIFLFKTPKITSEIQLGFFEKIELKLTCVISGNKILSFMKYFLYYNTKAILKKLLYSKKNLIDQKNVAIEDFLQRQ
jgi:glycosyltransferase involved in cell wall biosynthesis